MSNRFTLLGWSAWCPGLPDRDTWKAWLPKGGPLQEVEAKPACKAAKPLLRRRFSLNTRMFVETAAAACEDAGVDAGGVHVLYGTENGEIAALKTLLTELSNQEPLSPTAFINSVQHVPAGHFGMVTHNKRISRMFSAFEDTFVCGFMEAATLLRQAPDEPVLLVVADEILLEPFDQMLTAPPFPYAVSLVLSGVESDQSFEFERVPGVHQADDQDREPAIEFLKWWIGETSELQMKTVFGGVAWKR